MTNWPINKRQLTGLVLGPILFLVMLILPQPVDMPARGMQVAAVAVLMATYWMTEAIPIPATALFPIALFPLLGVMPTQQVTVSYGNHLIYLFMGGFLIAVAIEKWQLHRRMALYTILLVGASSNRIVLGFMLATAFLSSWISNTATAMMMVTIGLAVIRQTNTQFCDAVDEGGHCDSQFATSLMLGIAYAASIGGIATLIGTPPNAILAGVYESTYGYSIGFAEWMMFGLPLSMTMLIICWIYLTRFAFTSEIKELPGGKQAIREQIKSLGAMTMQEKKVLAVFTLVASGWLIRGLFDIAWLKAIQDSSIAITGALLLFIVPSDLKKGEFLLNWQTAVKIPWDIIILFGGGFALASGFVSVGLTEWIADQFTILQGTGLLLITVAVVLMVVFLTEITSNTATASLLIPVMGAFALAVEAHPLSLMAAVALSASFAFMLPVATPPNAIVFSSRQVTIPQMAKAGFWLNLIGTVLITAFVLGVLPYVFDLDKAVIMRP